MPKFICRVLRPLLLGATVALASAGVALAQTSPAPVQVAPAAESGQQRQVDLSARQIEGVLASQKEFDAIVERTAESSGDQPDPKVAAQFDAVARKYGFANYDEYSDALDMIGLVLAGVDPKTKKFIGGEAVIRQQIAAIEADSSIPAEDRKQALEQLNDALKQSAPTIRNKTNIDLVEKYYDQLNAAIQENE